MFNRTVFIITPLQRVCLSQESDIYLFQDTSFRFHPHSRNPATDQPQNGIVVEGVEDVAEGMQVPSSEISIIGPQKVTKEREEAFRNKLQQSNLAN